MQVSGEDRHEHRLARAEAAVDPGAAQRAAQPADPADRDDQAEQAGA
jgi:hypothetical protein